MYHNKIKNPATGRWVNANGTIGKKLQQRSDMQVGGFMNNFSNKAASLASKTLCGPSAVPTLSLFYTSLVF